jgi:hypothetical protein
VTNPSAGGPEVPSALSLPGPALTAAHFEACTRAGPAGLGSQLRRRRDAHCMGERFVPLEPEYPGHAQPARSPGLEALDTATTSSRTPSGPETGALIDNNSLGCD